MPKLSIWDRIHEASSRGDVAEVSRLHDELWANRARDEERRRRESLLKAERERLEIEALARANT